MSYNKNTKLIKLEKYLQYIDYARNLRYAFFFYSFLCFIFWFLNCFEVDWLYMFNWLFIGPYKILSTYYRPQGVTIDFSLAFIGGFFAVLGAAIEFLCVHLIEQISVQIKNEERQERERMRRIRERNMKKRAVQITEEQMQGGFQNMEVPKLLFLILPHINKIKKTNNELELTFQEVEVWKQRLNKRLIENIIYSKPMQKGYYRKNLFLMYQDFNYVDEFVYYTKPTLDSVILEFKKYNISVSFSYVLSALPQIQDLEKELDCMDTVLSLNFINQFVVTNRFKLNYNNRPICKYFVELKGEYNLSKNLSISNRQSLFVLKDKEIKENRNENEDENNQDET